MEVWSGERLGWLGFITLVGMYLTRRTPHGCMPHRRVPPWACTSLGEHLVGVYLVGMYLVGMDFVGVHLMRGGEEY